MPPTAAEIRQQFIDFFVKRHGHTFAPSSPVIPHEDPTLLFTNAGMNQFKDVFLGTGSRDYRRAVNSQKCIRAGGKHNDLEDVGKDQYHHTFFEMLGNWSFGDYFKADAIRWAWELLTDVWGLDKRRLYVTVFAGDEAEGLAPDSEAEELWKSMTDIDPSHILRCGKEDNFWEMGETGPCGPCSEIHYDFTDDLIGGSLVNAGDERVIEFWNLVFIQFNRVEGGALSPLPAKHVDTGMGFERIARILQNKRSNYDVDLWTPIFMAIESRCAGRTPAYGGKLEDPIDIAYRVIADHLRCLTFALTDGAVPGNEGRGYVLRRILRRAARHGRQTLGIDGPFVHQLVHSVVDSMGAAYPELRRDPERVMAIIRDEEETFGRTLDRGIGITGNATAVIKEYENQLGTVQGEDYEPLKEALEKAWDTRKSAGPALECISADLQKTVDAACKFASRIEAVTGVELSPTTTASMFVSGARVPGEVAFALHDTYGFPIDLTEVMAEERGMTVDFEGYERLMDEARERARAAGAKGKAGAEIALTGDEIARLKHLGIEATRDIDKYHGRAIGARIEAIWNGRNFDNETQAPGLTALQGIITNQTNFYAEQGGQIGDSGRIFDVDGHGEFEVLDTRAHGGYVLHIGRTTRGRMRVGDQVQLEVESSAAAGRAPIMANHTGTHLLNFALRRVIGPDVDQKGSLVAPDRLRFDFSTSHALTVDEIERVTRIVNEQIERDLPVYAESAPLEQARSIRGLRAVFGERYPDPVRVICVGQPVMALLAEPGRESWGEYSVEFCGGTHVSNTGEIGAFEIIGEEAVAKGVRRVIAVTGDAATSARSIAKELDSRLSALDGASDERLPLELAEIVEQVNDAAIPLPAKARLRERIEEYQRKVKDLKKSQRAGSAAAAIERARVIADEVKPGGANGCVIVAEIEDADADALRAAMDVVKSRHAEAAVLLLGAAPDEEKVAIIARVPDSLIRKGLKAGDWAREVAKVCGGGGGGKPDSAQAGGKDPSKIPAAIDKAREFAEAALR